MVRSHPKSESPSQVRNGDLGHHEDRAVVGKVFQVKQEPKVPENGLFGGMASASASPSPSLSHSQENGVVPSRDEQENPEKDKEEGLGPPRRKRGRRKLERPTKCKPWRRSCMLAVITNTNSFHREQ